MNSELQKARDHFIETAGRLCKSLGLNEIAGQLYALLYLSPEPISLNEMVEMLKISKASASVNIRALEGWGAAKKVWVKGNRRDHYTADRDIQKIIIERLRGGFERRISEANGLVEQAEKMLNGSVAEFDIEDRKLAKTYKQRIGDIKKLSARAQKLLKFIPMGL